MKSPSLRASLMLWVVGLTACVLSAFALALHEGVRRSLIQGVDGELAARIEGATVLCEWEDGHVRVELPDSMPASKPSLDQGCVEICALPSGEVLHRWGGEGPRFDGPLPAVAAPFAAETLATKERSWRIATTITLLVDQEHPSLAGVATSGLVMVRAAKELASMNGQLRSIAWFTAAAAGLLTIAVICFASFLSRRIARPLAELGRAADGARHGDGSAMPNRGCGDEIDQLAVVLDESFRSLRTAVARQRRFAADASHELRNPLAALQNVVEVALRRPRSPQEYEATLHAVLANVRRMGSMLESLLLLARIDARGIASIAAAVDMSALAREVAMECDPTGSRIEVIGAAAARVPGQAALLAIALRNLVDNALRHAGTALPVTLAVRTREDAVEVEVRDRGPGLVESERTHVFEPFFRGASEAAGTGAGLGLAIVAAIVAQHGGQCCTVDVETGACFRIVLPRHRGE